MRRVDHQTPDPLAEHRLGGDGVRHLQPLGHELRPDPGLTQRLAELIQGDGAGWPSRLQLGYLSVELLASALGTDKLLASTSGVILMRHGQSVVEVRYEHMEGDRFRHTAQFNRWRPDRDPRSCTYEQLEEPVSYDLADILATKST